MRKTFTYDDVNIVPKFSTLDSRSEVELKTRFTKNTNIDIPIVSSPMDTVTESDMSIEMMRLGGVGIIHRFNTIEEQVDHVIETTYFRDSEVRDKYTHLPICAAVGVTGDYLERATELFHNGCKVLLIDVAHGHHKNVGEAIEEIKTKLSGIEIIAGNVATESGTRFLCEKGADSIRVGIGNGSLCETRIRTGVGVPQVSALLECVSVADKYDVPIIADGGIRNIGDVCKGLACGADTIMLGSLLSGTKETPGEIEKVGQWPNEKLFKKLNINTQKTWDKVLKDKGSIQGIKELNGYYYDTSGKLTQEESGEPVKNVFKTFKEINQLELVGQAGIRQTYVDQSVSLNLAFPSQAEPRWINKVHMEAWKRGIKTLYYMRTESVLRGDIAAEAMNPDCLSCDG